MIFPFPLPLLLLLPSTLSITLPPRDDLTQDARLQAVQATTSDEEILPAMEVPKWACTGTTLITATSTSDTSIATSDPVSDSALAPAPETQKTQADLSDMTWKRHRRHRHHHNWTLSSHSNGRFRRETTPAMGFFASVKASIKRGLKMGISKAETKKAKKVTLGKKIEFGKKVQVEKRESEELDLEKEMELESQKVELEEEELVKEGLVKRQVLEVALGKKGIPWLHCKGRKSAPLCCAWVDGSDVGCETPSNRPNDVRQFIDFCAQVNQNARCCAVSSKGYDCEAPNGRLHFNPSQCDNLGLIGMCRDPWWGDE